ncbi:polysaccharide biosynthesis C-terminal domain-containing protein [Cysteiniphilum halobium]|uniref:polysaccharide biosynthesis C-terminal domain-containing protein n=1 Tax=Cysteiniphilum halobium TaxID=2219059 RepID=UPI003F85BBC2
MRRTILVTGANGFIAKNLITQITHCDVFDYNVVEANRQTSDEALEQLVESADIIMHLAGENRPKSDEGFIEGNLSYTQKICDYAKKHRLAIIYASSTQAELDSSYGQSKLAAENTLENYSNSTNANVSIVRLPNVFGKWCKPNYNSFVATMCYNLWRDTPVKIDDTSKMLTLVYIDDVVRTLIEQINEILDGKVKQNVNYFNVVPRYQKSLGSIYEALQAIKNGQKTLQITERAEGLERALAATFMSYCPKDKIKYALAEYSDDRGTFYEVFKLAKYGQVSISTTKPGVTRGNHFHHSKQEKFLVVKGECEFKFRSLNTGEIINFCTSDKVKEVVEVPLGYTHNFTNIGSDELVVLIWCNEAFDRNNPDTYALEV